MAAPDVAADSAACSPRLIIIQPPRLGHIWRALDWRPEDDVVAAQLAAALRPPPAHGVCWFDTVCDGRANVPALPTGAHRERFAAALRAQGHQCTRLTAETLVWCEQAGFCAALADGEPGSRTAPWFALSGSAARAPDRAQPEADA